jgi:hypothetical protein
LRITVSEPTELDVALRFAAILEDLDIEYALGGSLASSLHGEPRSTNDIDFAVHLAPHHVAPLTARLGPDFVVDETEFGEAVRLRRPHPIFYLPFVLKIDVFVRGATSFDRSELSRRVRVAIGDRGQLWVAAAEDNLLRKLVWFREGGSVSDRQWRDVLGILRVAGMRLDRPYLQQWAEHLAVDDLLSEAFEQANMN